MIDLDALSAAGLTNAYLKKVFTAKPPSTNGKKVPTQKKPERGGAPFTGPGTVTTPITLERLPDNPSPWDVRCYLETMIRGQIIEGQARCANLFDKFAAVDLAYSSIPIHPLVPDLMKVAMGHITIDQCHKSIAGMSERMADVMFEKDSRGKVQSVNRPKLIEVSHNLVNSFVTRRVAALATEIYQTYPVLKYDTFSNTQTAKLGGDVMTQIAEQMAGMYDYRHDYEESIRQSSLYTSSFKFKSQAWTADRQTLPDYPPANGADNAGRKKKPPLKRRIVKEGVLFKLPHPSRVSWDIGQPLSKLNSDCGPNWINHWELVQLGAILDDPAYFNTDCITYDRDMYGWMEQYASYFSQYYGAGGCTTPDSTQKINPWCDRGCTSAAALSLSNDRVANIGAWAQTYRGVSTILTQHYIKMVPKQNGLGRYEDPVWIRFVMAANTTVVYAEICGSCPASVSTYNGCDGLLINQSFAMQAIQWQQMLTNDLNELQHVTAQGLIRVWCINTDGMAKGEIELVENTLKNPDFAELKDIVIKYKLSLLNARAEDSRTQTEKIKQIQIDTAGKATEIFNRMVQTLALAERLMFFSPSELGQVSPRTTTATEQKSIKDTTLGIRDYHLIGVKAQINADKRIIHDSYMAFGSDEIECPVAGRYDLKVIEAAGFEVVDDGSGPSPDGLYTIRGKKLGVAYDYVYTTRNTDDLPPDAARAQGIAQVYDILSKDQVLSSNMTLDQRIELVNSLFGILSPEVAKLRVPPGVDGSKTQAGEMQQMQEQSKTAFQQIAQSLQQLNQKQQQTDQQVQQISDGQKALAQALTQLSGVLAKQAVPTTPPARPALPVAPTGPALPGGAPNAPGVPIPGVTAARLPRGPRLPVLQS